MWLKCVRKLFHLCYLYTILFTFSKSLQPFKIGPLFKVPNVRLGVARTMSKIDAETDFYKRNQPSEEGEVAQDQPRDESSSRLRIETVC